MPCISVTFSVLKLLKSSDARKLQLSNMPPMSVTFSVLKLLKSSDARELQSWNMRLMSMTFSVLRFRMSLMSCNFMHFWNQRLVEVGR